MEKYATKIPVVSALNAQKELCWPFNENSFTQWCHSFDVQ